MDMMSPLVHFVRTKCFVDWDAFILYSVWFWIQLIADRVLPGEEVRGQPVAELKGKRLKYVMNGWNAWMLTHVLTLYLLVQCPTWTALIVDRLFGILTVAQIYALAMALMAYIVGYRSGTGCRLSGYLVYDFFMGYARVPRLGDFDLKLFCEARPGLQLWIVLNAVMVAHDYRVGESFDPQMVAIFVMQYLYICDYFWFEDAILTTMDLIHDKFGFMLSFGDLVWVPWTYTLQIQCLYFQHQRNGDHGDRQWGYLLSIWLLAMNMLFVAGYVVFRVSNLQKHRFRMGEPGESYRFIETERGSKLLISGWWGVGRHMNYTGDWIMSCAQSLCCDCCSLFAAPFVAYFNPIYFAVLLVHRERRDHARCAMKYGKDWDTYCSKVKYRLIPYVY